MQVWRQGRVRAVERVACAQDADALVLDHLTRMGCDPGAARECRHYFYVPYEVGARAVVTSLVHDGWDADCEEMRDTTWLVTATTMAALDHSVVRDTRVRLEALAEDHGGEYDGWEAAAD
jgi:regulator of RNase E activity RraB